ncbi:hypothetical protein [Phascolarctobacterium succinatutens]
MQNKKKNVKNFFRAAKQATLQKITLARIATKNNGVTKIKNINVS